MGWLVIQGFRISRLNFRFYTSFEDFLTGEDSQVRGSVPTMENSLL